jgi:anhydro-N-acetylmuramic acid kinase
MHLIQHPAPHLPRADVTLYIGLISGTSMDGVEAVVLDIDAGRLQIRSAVHVDYSDDVATRLRAAVANPAGCGLDEFGALDAAVGEAFAAATSQLLQITGYAGRDIRAIGSHGQTLLHRPRTALPYTIQIGDPNRIAERTGIDVVADFRRRDVAAGGEGAPLVPAFHAAAFSQAGQTRVVVNIGGIANITVLATDGTVTGFDTGPGNCLMDLWAREQLGTAYDKDGALAASGRVNSELLQLLLAEPYLRQAPPKSTGRELFHREWLQPALQRCAASVADVQATLSEYTAVTIAQGITALARAQPIEVLVCGGGAYNIELMRRLAAQLPTARVLSTAQRGIAPEHVEAALFAWLAHRFLVEQPGNLVAVTGARGPRVLGALYRGTVTST